MQKVYIYLENGIFLEANSFGADTTAVGKLVYNNSTFGQQEIITDPSNNGLFINFTDANNNSFLQLYRLSFKSR